MAAKKGLGRGLDSLIVKKDEGIVAANPSAETTVEVDINKVEPNKNQPRRTFNEDALVELSESIKLYGIIEPLIVQERDNYYMIIGGERRWRAAKMAGLKKVPVIVKNLTEQEIDEISLIDNIQREALNPIDEAFAYKRLLEEYNLKQEEVAERVSKSRTTITNSIRLLKLDDRVQKMIVQELITTGHARAILGIGDKDKQFEFAQRVVDEKLSVRDVEREVKKLSETKVKKDKEPVIDPQLAVIYQDTEEKLKGILGTKVAINFKTAQSGKMEIEYYTRDELDRIISMLQSIK